jgi:hypothetical protein
MVGFMAKMLHLKINQFFLIRCLQISFALFFENKHGTSARLLTPNRIMLPMNIYILYLSAPLGPKYFWVRFEKDSHCIIVEKPFGALREHDP